MNSPRLKPYHNPENVDESRVPTGWRFLYADEAGREQKRPCRLWINNEWDAAHWFGDSLHFTYIVPVASKPPKTPCQPSL